MKKLLLRSALASTLLFSVSHAESNFIGNTFEVAVTGSYTMYNDDPIDDGLGFGVRGGYRFAKRWTAVLDYKYFLEADVDGRSDDTAVHRYSANIHFDVLQDKAIAFYGIAGFGYDDYTDYDDRDGTVSNLGIGFLAMINDSMGIFAEGIWSHVLSGDTENEDHGIATAGFKYLF